ncbi:MAG TPA: LuxR C-terminal-related transcriptional regulator [Actinocrinis sp.]|nr:LuxR C-terminal-related transcriptional regulator [Actinocrinis sp.]
MSAKSPPNADGPAAVLVLVATGDQAADRLRSLAGLLAPTAQEQAGEDATDRPGSDREQRPADPQPPPGQISARLFTQVDDALLDCLNRLTIRPARPVSAPRPAGPDSRVALTEREAQILALVALGQSNRLISRWLFVSESTVKAHLTRLYIKFAVDNRTAAVLAARRLGLLPD